MTTPNDSPPLPTPDPWGCLIAALAIAAALWLAGCASRSNEGPPDVDGGRCAWTSPLPDGGRWYAPTWGASRARARWYCDPSWRRDENIPALGYGG